MSNKHTPAPWISMHEEYDPETKWAIDIRNNKPYADKDSQWIASVHTQFQGDEIGIANAKLIAAAPELLEALQSFPGLIGSEQELTLWVEVAKAAIRKATE